MPRPFRALRLNADSFPVECEEISTLEEANADWIAIEGYESDEIISKGAECDALLVVSSRLTPDTVRQLKRCRVIARLGSGTDRIAVDTATQRGIIVCNVPDFSTIEMAEHAMALLLCWGRQLFYMEKQMRLGNWTARSHPSVHRISGQTLGLVGFGESGQAFASRARAFGMNVQACVRQPEKYKLAAQKLAVPLVSLDTVLLTSDYVSLHVPLTNTTRKMIGALELGLMKQSAVLINTARGAIVDETILVNFLREKRIAGALLDTYEEIDVFGTRTVPKHPLLELNNVIMTPHSGGTSVESAKDQKIRGAAYAACVLKGKWPPYVVNKTVRPWSTLSRY